jgi:hypothetical protein
LRKEVRDSFHDPTDLSAIDTATYNKLNLHVQHAQAAYCTNNDAPVAANTFRPLSCPIVPCYAATNAEIIYGFNG